MVETAQIEIKDQDLLGTLRTFLKDVLGREDIGAMLVPWQLPMRQTVMPTLITAADQLDRADPLSPAFALNSAKLTARLTRKPVAERIVVVMRPCEIRAFIELVKLKQGRIEDVVIIALDCLGAMPNTVFNRWVGDDVDASSTTFAKDMLAGKEAASDDTQLSQACQVCDMPVPAGADLAIGLFGSAPDGQLLVEAQSDKGRQLMIEMGLKSVQPPAARKKAVADLVSRRAAARDDLFSETRAATDSVAKLSAYLAQCVNCYNCRVACPVCYCRECVFVTDVFDHEPAQYLQWAKSKAVVKMPTDTLFYHTTRLAHMSTACVGCGQCSNACPNDIPVMALFKTIADRTQKAFDYQAGRSVDEKPPLSEFKEEEFDRVVGMGGSTNG